MLVDLHDARVAVLLETLIVLLAETKSLHQRATDRARTFPSVRLDVAAPTNTLQVLRRVVEVVAIQVMDILRLWLPAPIAWPRRHDLPRVISRSRWANYG